MFLAAVFVSLFTFDKYGIAWDEKMQRGIGALNWNFIFHHDNTLLSRSEADHGAAFELPLTALEKIFGSEDPYAVFLLRHLVTHLFFLLGAIYCYRLTKLLYGNKLLSLVAFLLFTLQPLIYAHSFFNSKDVPFLSLFTICFYFCAKLMQEKTIRRALILGIGLGLLINIRIMGGLLLVCVFFLLFLDILRERKITVSLRIALVLLLSCVFSFYASWPYLWNHPLDHFMLVLKRMSHFPWSEKVLFRGNEISADQISWNYIPVWFSITNPIPYLIIGFIGICRWGYLIIKQDLVFDFKARMNLVFLICFFGPVLAVVILHSVLYDTWRHLFFIYPAFVMLMVFGLEGLLKKFRKTTLVFVSLSFVFVIVYMVIYFPFQHIYFNAFVSLHKEKEYIRKHYEMDYWGLSYKQCLEYILKYESAPVISIYSENEAGYFNYSALPPGQRKRIYMVSKIEDAYYFMSNYRWHKEDYPFEDKKIFSIKVLGNTVNSVYKLK